MKYRDALEAWDQQASGAYWSDHARAHLRIALQPRYGAEVNEDAAKMAIYCQRQAFEHYRFARKLMGIDV